jgi:F-type H+-transporting ATPase subunit a
MLALLLGSGVYFVYAGLTGMIGPIQAFVVGPLWFVFGMAIFTLELLVLALQAYIFTLLSAVYIESSLHPAH